jgi:hypothetical protein
MKRDGAELGDVVSAKVAQLDEGPNGEIVIVALPGQIGHVIEIDPEPSALPTIYWETTGRVLGGFPGEDFEILAEADFATRPETTPTKPRTEFITRTGRKAS